MGISNSWFAVQGWTRDEALAELGLQVDRDIGDAWPGRRAAVGEISGGWLLFIDSDLKASFREPLVALSKRGPAVACAVEEHVMYSEARGYVGGVEVWRVVHNSEDGLDHLEVTGAAPAGLDTLRKAALADMEAEGGEDADVDYVHDVPLDAAKAICGFKHDDEWPEGLSFTTLKRIKPERAGGGRPGFFQRLFGGR